MTAIRTLWRKDDMPPTIDIFLYNRLYLYSILAESKSGETVYVCNHIYIVFPSVISGAARKIYIFLDLYLYKVLWSLPGAVIVLCLEPAPI